MGVGEREERASGGESEWKRERVEERARKRESEMKREGGVGRPSNGHPEHVVDEEVAVGLQQPVEEARRLGEPSGHLCRAAQRLEQRAEHRLRLAVVHQVKGCLGKLVLIHVVAVAAAHVEPPQEAHERPLQRWLAHLQGMQRQGMQRPHTGELSLSAAREGGA